MATPSSILRRPPTNIDFMSTPSSSDAMPNTATTTTRESRRSLASRVTASITALISPRRPISAPVQAPSATLVQSRIEELKITSAVAPRFIQVKPKDHIPEKLDDKIQEQIRHLRCISSADQLPMTPHGTTLEKFKATFAIATHHMDVTQDAHLCILQ